MTLSFSLSADALISVEVPKRDNLARRKGGYEQEDVINTAFQHLSLLPVKRVLKVAFV
jgi:hypothetical protein